MRPSELAFWLAFGLALSPWPAVAAVPDRCPEPRGAADVIRCALDRSPETSRAALSVQHAGASEAAAGRLPNPTFTMQSAFLSTNGESRGDHQLSLTQPIDWGGVRGAQVRAAEGRRRLAEAEARSTKAEIAFQTLLKLHRVRQLDEEAHLYAEAAETLGKVVTMHASRPSLTPEQQVSLSVSRMAKGALDLLASALAEEERDLDSFFQSHAGVSLSQVKKATPARPEPWPALVTAAAVSSSRALKAQAEIALAEAELSAARAASWPELSVGPFALVQKDNGGPTRSLFGVQLSVGLPVFNINGAGRAAAVKGVMSAEKNLELTRFEDDSERRRLSGNYEAAVKALKATPSATEMARDHERMERLYVRGVIPSTLAIESHRQFLELLKTRNERELKALDAWWRVQLLDGKLPEAAL